MKQEIQYSTAELYKLQQLRNYYKNNKIQPTLIGMNDSQGITVKMQFYKNSCFNELASLLSDESLKAIAIDAFSLLNNKTEHINYLLRANPNLAEIKYMQIHSYQEAAEHFAQQMHVPYPIPKIIKLATGKVISYAIKPTKKDCTLKLTDTLKFSKQPIVIYSSGNNDLMRAYGNNPFSISKDYRLRHITQRFNYTMDQTENKEILIRTLNNIQINFENILSLNPEAQIYVLGPYIPKSLRKEEMNIFQDIILNFNDRLKELCERYHIHFINTCLIGETYNQSKTNFHVNYKGQHALAMDILNALYEDIILNEKNTPEQRKPYLYRPAEDGTILHAAIDTKKDYTNSMLFAKYLKQNWRQTKFDSKKEKKLAKFHIKRQYMIADEHLRESNSMMEAYQKAKKL